MSDARTWLTDAASGDIDIEVSVVVMHDALLAVLDIVEETLRDPQAYPWTPEDRVRIELAQDIGQAVNKVLGVDGCACGHPWPMHGPEAPGCVECECEYIREGVTNE